MAATVQMPDDREPGVTGETMPTVNPPTMGQAKADDRGQGVPSERLVDHAEALAAGHAITFPKLGGPSWMPFPDRPWCVGGHDEKDDHDDRVCAVNAPADGGEVDLSLMSLIDGEHMPYLTVDMVQGVYEIGPRIRISTPRDPFWLTMSTAEATELAQKLVQVADLGDQPLPTGPATGKRPFWLTTACPGWCGIEHDPADLYGDRDHALPDGEDDIIKVDLLLENSTSREPVFVEVGVYQHYRESRARMLLSKSGVGGSVGLTTGEARKLAGNLIDLVDLAENAEAGV